MQTLYKINSSLKRIFPDELYQGIHNFLLKLYRLRLEAFKEQEIRDLMHDFGIGPGSVVFIHSSMNQIKTEFPFHMLTDILLDIIGEEGTLMFPCWQEIRDMDAYIAEDRVFNVRRTPTYLGILPELARRRKDASRSWSPFNSVAAIGENAWEFLKDHHLDELSWGVKSPLYKLMEHKGFILGLGVTTRYLTFVHCIEDTFPGEFPVRTRLEKSTAMKVKTPAGEEILVKIRLPHSNIRHRNIPRYLKKHINPDIARDLRIKKTNFFIARARPLYEVMQDLAGKNITIYKKQVMRKGQHN